MLANPSESLMRRPRGHPSHGRLLRRCDKHAVDYVVGIARNKVLERIAGPFMEEAKKTFDESDIKKRSFHEITYAAKT